MRIGIDLGGHTVTAARFDISCRERLEPTQIKNMTTPEGRGARDTLSMIADAVAELAGGDRPDAVGLTLPGMVSADRRSPRMMPNFPREWYGRDVVTELERLLAERGVHARAAVENDANCFALGEGIGGAAMGLRDFVVFTMGTGIGCGVVIGGELLRGAHGMAGEGGHLVTGGDSLCGCGGIGHAETIAAADGTSARAREAGLPEEFRDLWPMRGTPAADAVLSATVDAMARAVASVEHLLDPEAVVIGGGMSEATGIVEAIADRAMLYLSEPFRRELDVRKATLGSRAAMYGAATL